MPGAWLASAPLWPSLWIPQRRVVWMWFGAFPGAFGLGRACPVGETDMNHDLVEQKLPSSSPEAKQHRVGKPALHGEPLGSQSGRSVKDSRLTLS